MEKKSPSQLRQLIDQGKQQAPLWSKRVHYKHPESNFSYIIADIVIEEATGQAMVIYECYYAAAQWIRFARPITSFLETIEYEWKKVSRFQRIDVSPVISTEA